MPRYKNIYINHVDAYDRLVSLEDWQKNISKTLNELIDLQDLHVVEFGAGTGRITALLATKAKKIQAFDLYPNMVALGAEKFEQLGFKNVTFGVADNKCIPVADNVVDLTIAGWSFGHCTSWFPDTWKNEISNAVSEMFRIMKPNGTAIILETLGTGRSSPNPPSEKHSAYYKMLESEFGFERTWIRTDYKFKDMNEAKNLTQTFFAREYEFEKTATSEVLLPECTGIWFRKGKSKN